ncbi:FkbM family methyltransferase [Methylobacterium aquaticum]|uniref:FkbM family methyltransferase n=1 Tax=Methylobacterium aquaticum TaxID=270351 RepID=UPI003D16C348
MDRPSWLAPNYTEPRVLVAVRDICGAGNDVLDVGANFGGITIAMSRAVGPRGSVFGFEANPAIAKRCQANIVEAGCGNVQIVHSAIYSSSGKFVDLYLSDNMVADSIHYKVSNKSIMVPTLSLDDFVTRMKVQPTFVKMDIEGAEYDALLGFEGTLKFLKPLLILEQAPSEARCVDFLINLGYRAIDLSTYQEINSISQLAPETIVTDILFGHGDALDRINYRPGTTTIATVNRDELKTEDLILRSNPIHLQAGRYIVQADYASDEQDSAELFCGVWIADHPEPLMQHHGSTNSLARLAHRWVFDLAAPNDVSIFFRCVGKIPASFNFSHANIMSVDCFNTARSLWV